MPMPWKISKDDVVIFDGGEFRFDRETGDDLLLFTNLRSGAPLQVEDRNSGDRMLPSVAWFTDMLREDRLQIERRPDLSGVRRAARRLELEAQEIREMDQKAALRYFVVTAYDENPVPRGNKAIRCFLEGLFRDPEVRTRFGGVPSASTVRGWLSRGDIGNRMMIDMLSMSGRAKRAKRLDPVVEEVLHRHATDCYTNHGRTVYQCYAAFHAEMIAINAGKIPRGQSEIQHLRPAKPYPIPSYETLRRRVRELECVETYGAKYGKRAAQGRWLGGGHPLEASRILELALQDDTPLPGIFCIDPDRSVPVGQPLLTIMVDYFSRCILGWHLTFSPPSQWTAAQTIVHANTPKAVPARFAERYPLLATICGKPSEIAWDNTLFHYARGMEDSLADVGIGLRMVGVEEPTHKAVVERLFSTLNKLLLSFLPGATFEIARMRECGYNPEEHAVITVAELEALIAEAVAIYHVTPCKGLQNRQPALVWQKSNALHKIDRIDHQENFLRSIGAVEYECTLSKTGIDKFGLRYSDRVATRDLLDRLAAHEPQRRRTKAFTAKVKIKYNPNDLGQVHVWNGVDRVYVALPCTQQRYASGLPLWLHNRICEFAKAEALEFNSVEERLEARDQLTAIVQDIAPSARQRERRLLARLLECSHVKSVGGELVTLKSVLASPSGMESAVPFDLAAPTRVDSEIVPPRSQRGREYQGGDRRDAGRAKPGAQNAALPKNRSRLRRRAAAQPQPKPDTSPVKRAGTKLPRNYIYE